MQEMLPIRRNIPVARRHAGHTIGCLNNKRGLLAENVVVVRTSVTQNSQSDLKKSCFPSRDQAGAAPPAEEICVLAPSAGYGRTYTSFRSDSSET